MEYQEGAKVYFANGEEAGRIKRVVINPVSMQVSDIVVQHGLLPSKEKVVAVAMVERSDENGLYLKEIEGGLDSLPDFQETSYRAMTPGDLGETGGYENTNTPPILYAYPTGVPVSGGAYPPGAVLTDNPAGLPVDVGSGYIKENRQNIAEGSVALKQGARVLSRDGADLGTVERVFTYQGDGQVTAFIISSGLLLKARKLVPYGWVEQLFADEVHLAVNARFIEQLPNYQE